MSKIPMAGSQQVGKEQKIVTRDELSRHTSDGDLWICIQGKVYDVSGWAMIHPGGDLPLKNFAGQPDCTDAFLPFHPPRVLKMLPKFLVGTLAADAQERQIPHPLTQDRERVLQLLAQSGLMKVPIIAYVKLFLFIFLAFNGAVAGVVLSSSLALHLLSSVLLGLMWIQNGYIVHDVGHSGITGHPPTDRFLGLFVGNILTGVGMAWWKKSHNVHHYSCNSLEYDPDVQYMPIFAFSSKLFASLHSYFYNRKMHFDSAARFLITRQHWTFYLVMAVARINLYAQTFIVAIFDKRVRQRGIELVTLGFFWVWFSCLLSYLPNNWERLAFVLVALVTTGIQHVQVCLSHLSCPMYVGKPHGDHRWLEAQCTGSLNLGCSRWWDWFHGGLHFQIEHHLFPNLPRHNLRKASERFIKPLVIDKHKLPYNSVSFWEANLMIIRTLRAAAIEARDLSKPLTKKSLLWEAVNAHG